MKAIIYNPKTDGEKCFWQTGNLVYIEQLLLDAERNQKVRANREAIVRIILDAQETAQATIQDASYSLTQFDFLKTFHGNVELLLCSNHYKYQVNRFFKLRGFKW